ncbi:hypothetical protein DXG01_005977, partial [Tephrocybe rancida]
MAPLPMPLAKHKPIDSWPRSPTPSPSNNPLLATALQARVTLPSHTPPPGPCRAREGDWFEEMVEYVDEVNTTNVEHQQCISSAVGRLSAIVNALLNSAAAVDELWSLASWVSGFEDSTDIGFKRLKERCDQMSGHITDLEQHIEKLECRELEQRTCSMRPPSPIAGPLQQGCTFVSLSPGESSVERSNDDEEGEEGEAGQEDEGGDVSLGTDTGMDDFSNDPLSPSSQDELDAGEVTANITVAVEMEIQVRDPSVPGNSAPLTSEGPPIPATSPLIPGNSALIPGNSALIPDNSALIPSSGDVQHAPPAQIFLGGGPIIPSVAEANPPSPTGGATVPVIHLINPMPDNSQEQLAPPGPLMCITVLPDSAQGPGQKVEGRQRQCQQLHLQATVEASTQ